MRSKGIVLAVAVAGLALMGTGVASNVSKQARRSASVVEQSGQDLGPLIHSIEGPNLFRAYCASCHGLDGKGNGPAAEALRTKPADLTALTRNHRGQFPVAMVRDTITGDSVVTAHGSREMPIWGPVFHQIEADVDRGHVRVENLVKYLESIQGANAKISDPKAMTASPKPPEAITGAQLFSKNCAVCHAAGANAPEVPSPFRTPPDLTTLAQRHSGKFPEAYVRDVLHNGVELPAHGPAEMPIWGADFLARDKMNEKQVASRIDQLTDYLKSIQAK
jgi:mono/diheme cytochrome c family protein